MSAESRYSLTKKKKSPLLGYGTKSDARVEYVTPRNLTNGNIAGNGVLYGPAPIMTSCNRGILGIGVFCWARPDAVSRGSTEQVSQSRCGTDTSRPGQAPLST
jgi:hypothetical protein